MGQKKIFDCIELRLTDVFNHINPHIPAYYRHGGESLSRLPFIVYIIQFRYELSMNKL
jgi:hypothetical protein